MRKRIGIKLAALIATRARLKMTLLLKKMVIREILYITLVIRV